MRFERIMCPVDFSASSQAALDDAASLAKKLGAQLLIVHVDERPSHAGAASSSLFAAGQRELLERTQPRIDGVVVERRLIAGRPEDAIPRFARSQNIDLVVMGHRERDQRFHARHDGLCQSVTERCGCPVMTVTCPSDVGAWVG